MTSPIILAHGFTQTARSWTHIQQLLAERGAPRTVAVDLPGHGVAGDVHADLWGSAAHLVEFGGHGTYIGYSMGGRVCLHAALANPGAIERLVLISTTAGIDDDTERDQRRAADDALADRIVQIGLERFIDQWLAGPLFAALTDDTSQRADRLRNTTAGLARSLRLTGTGQQEPLWSRLGEIAVPVLVLVGETDERFRRIGERLTAGLPDATIETVAAAGHSVHLEQPVATVDAIMRWLAATN